MELVALTGKPKSGKTTLASELNKKGYEVINFTDVLKDEATRILSYYDEGVVDGTIKDNKEKYRGFLQELGTHIGFDTNTKWVKDSVLDWRLSCDWVEHTVPAVFDNVRTPQQWEVLKGYGFKLVRLNSVRAGSHRWVDGVVLTSLSPNAHPIESALDHVEADLTLNGDLEVEYLVWKVLNS